MALVAPASMLARAGLVMNAVARRRQLTLSAVVELTGLPKSSAHRLLSQMVSLGWLDHAEGGYQLGLRMFELGASAPGRRDPREVALPFMQDLYEITHETVNLAALDGSDIVYLEKIAGHRRSRGLTRVGGRFPAHCTSTGKALLAFAPEAVVDAVVAAGLRPRTRYSITSEAELRRDLAAVRKRGYAVDRNEAFVGWSCVAAPVFGPDRSAVAALGVSARDGHLSVGRVSAAVRTAALAVSRAWQRVVEPVTVPVGGSDAPRRPVSR